MRFILLFLWCAWSVTTVAQELNATVRVTTPKLQTTDPRIFRTLEADLTDLLNNTSWTQDRFETNERINMTVNFAITSELGDNQFKATMNVQSLRPVFGSDYQTSMFTFQDKEITFVYLDGQPLRYAPNVFSDNLTAVISYYAYLVIAMDYDSFGLFSGDPYYAAAQEIINTLPTGYSNDPGWTSIGRNKNRYWLIENMQSARVKGLRKAIYDYHLQSLDVMHKNSAGARDVMLKSIELLEQVNTSYPNSMVLSLFSGTKAKEIVDIFANASSQQKSRIYQIMTKIDPSNSQQYQNLTR